MNTNIKENNNNHDLFIKPTFPDFQPENPNDPCIKYCLDFYKSKYEITYYIKNNKYQDMNESNYLYYKTICNNICQMFQK